MEMKTGQKRAGNVAPAPSGSVWAASDATHSVHYNEDVVRGAGSVQQRDKVLPL